MHIVSRRPNEPAPARVGPLAVLPVFLPLRGKRVIVAGGSDGATWKAELLAASGARVEIVSPHHLLSPRMRQLLKDMDTLEHGGGDWRNADFTGAAIIVGDVGDDEAADFAAKARLAGIPVNIIDKPDFCDFQFGSIVNRSPVVVGISTDGAAPVLAQAVRRRIEMLLPRSLGAWGVLAHRVRAKVMARFKPGVERRLFWERFADRAFSAAPGSMADLFEDAANGTGAAPGRIALVGVEPDAADLLTVRAVRALQAADVIFFDDPTPAEVHDLARREATRIPASRHADIGEAMLEHARHGRNVVRLVNGVAALHGAGQAAEALEGAGIAVDIVPMASARSSVRAGRRPERGLTRALP